MASAAISRALAAKPAEAWHNRCMTRWIFENPWPLALLFMAVGAALLWRNRADGSRPLLLSGLVAILVGAATLLAGRLVTSPGEEAARVARELVARAEAADIDDAIALFSENAVLNYGRRENPGDAIAEIKSALRTLETRHRITSNRIRRLEARTLDGDTGEVELSCSTSTGSFEGAIPTDWIIRVRREGDGWRIDRLTFETLFAKPPPPSVWR